MGSCDEPDPAPLRGEREYPVEPLRRPTRSPGSQKGKCGRPDGALSASQAAIAAICARMDGVPMAIELERRDAASSVMNLLARWIRGLAVTVDGRRRPVANGTFVQRLLGFD